MTATAPKPITTVSIYISSATIIYSTQWIVSEYDHINTGQNANAAKVG